MTPLINIARAGYLGTGEIDLIAYAIGWIVTLVLLFIGVILFSKVEKTFMDTV